ncbi:hypothetical protein BHM03_00003228 [Ensete ventricosum]|uniref:Uncharacterized protein n=1 Tax=Ensete ventricosum TaxID=4639 RepID=A0A426Z3I3_ENSVE|nr:hypothetical protein B296_00003849 [Ensete ventricosum]RZR78007.1 hypothetical protein BHM03_00003228 [Ensete ventricosum]
MAGGSSDHGGLGRSPVRRPAAEAQPQRTSPPTYAIFLCNRRSSDSFFLFIVAAVEKSEESWEEEAEEGGRAERNKKR